LQKLTFLRAALFKTAPKTASGFFYNFSAAVRLYLDKTLVSQNCHLCTILQKFKQMPQYFTKYRPKLVVFNVKPTALHPAAVE